MSIKEQVSILRMREVAVATIAESAAQSNAIELRGAGGAILGPAAWTAADICLLVSDRQAGTYSLLRDSIGTMIRLTNIPTGAAFTRPLPDEVYAWPWMKLVSTNTASEAEVNQAAARTIQVVMKG